MFYKYTENSGMLNFSTKNFSLKFDMWLNFSNNLASWYVTTTKLLIQDLVAIQSVVRMSQVISTDAQCSQWRSMFVFLV